MMPPAPLHARLEPRLWLFADHDRAWLERRERTDAVAAPTAADPTATRRLLDGAVATAWNRQATRPRPRIEMTPTRWIWRLCGYVHLTTQTPALLERAAARFEALGQPELARWAAVRAREEDKHDILALRDLAAMGVEGPRAVEALCPHPAQRLVTWFRQAALAPDPTTCVGYAYAVERLSLETGPEDIRAIQALLPPGLSATRCMRVHSGIGSDDDHVAETVAVVAGLPASLREAIAVATYEATLACADPDADEPRSDGWILERLTDAGCFREVRPRSATRSPR